MTTAAPSGAGSVREAVLAGVAGAGLGALTGALVGLPLPGAIVGGANGAISGLRRVYDWSSANGVGAFVLDSTWALGNTAAALGAHVLGAVRGEPGYVPVLSERRNRHVYRRGFQPRKGFAITLGNVISGAGDVDTPRRVKLVNDHEDVHVWQARTLGPLYPLLYVGWMVGGAAVGAIAWLTVLRHERCSKVVESLAYYANPLEWWAYSRDDHWPPRAMVAGLGPKRPAVAPFARR